MQQVNGAPGAAEQDAIGVMGAGGRDNRFAGRAYLYHLFCRDPSPAKVSRQIVEVRGRILRQTRGGQDE